MKHLSSVVSALILLSACKTTNSSEIKHDAGQPTRTNSPYFWTSLTTNEFLNSQGITPASQKTLLFTENDPMVVRLQHWVDKLDTKLREVYPDRLKPVPKPVVRLINSPIKNAFVAATQICFDNVQFSFTGHSYPTPISSEITSAAANFNGWSIAIGSSGCHHEVITAPLLEKHLSLLNSAEKGCKLKVNILDKDRLMVTPIDECPLDSMMANENSDPSHTYIPFNVPAVSRDFVVYTSILEDTPEDEIIAVIYHELGHYYRTHGSFITHDYLYHLTNENPASVPKVSNDLAADNSAFLDARRLKSMNDINIPVLKAYTPIGLFNPIPGQTIHTALIKILATMAHTTATQICGDSSFTGLDCSSCIEILKIEKATPDFETKYERFLSFAGPIPGEDKKNYLLYEPLAKSCVNNIKTTTAAVPFDVIKPLITLDDLVTMLRSGNIDPTIFPVQEMPFGDFLVEATKRLKDHHEYDFNAEAYKTAMEIKIVAKKDTDDLETANQTIAKYVQKVNDEHLGYYTFEEEADNMSAESLAMIGFDNTVGGSMALTLVFDADRLAKCTALRANNWLDDQGKSIQIPWGTVSDEHPDSCFRTRDFDKEATAHGYPRVAQSPTKGLAPGWNQLMVDLKDRMKGMNEGEGAQAAVMRLIDKRRSGSTELCSYNKKFSRFGNLKN